MNYKTEKIISAICLAILATLAVGVGISAIISMCIA